MPWARDILAFVAGWVWGLGEVALGLPPGAGIALAGAAVARDSRWTWAYISGWALMRMAFGPAGILGGTVPLLFALLVGVALRRSVVTIRTWHGAFGWAAAVALAERALAAGLAASVHPVGFWLSLRGAVGWGIAAGALAGGFFILSVRWKRI